MHEGVTVTKGMDPQPDTPDFTRKVKPCPSLICFSRPPEGI
jgi:hypothetical protein